MFSTSRSSSAPSTPGVQWRMVWRLLKPYWVSEEKWRARGLLLAIVALALGIVYLEVLFNDWNREFYNALDNRDYAAFREQLWRFSWLACIFIAAAIYKVYLMQALEMRWRAWMTQRYMLRWLDHQAYYRIEQTRTADNPDQRIAEDLRLLTSGSLNLGLGFLSSFVTLVSFAGILWVLSGPLKVVLAGQEWTIPGYMLWFALGYAAVGSALVWLVGRRLVEQNAGQQRFEADFRFGLIRLRENAEAIALYRGEQQEAAHAADRFDRIRGNWQRIMATTKRLNLASTFYMQFAVIFPFLVSAPRYFAGTIKLGGVMQVASAFGQVQSALSWFINAFEQLANWKASINRLAVFHAALDEAGEISASSRLSVVRNNVGAILLDRVGVQKPDGTVLHHPWSAAIGAGDRILIAGPSGCGKSTLLRALAGIWPHGEGHIELPQAWPLMFIPQRAYLPIGTLRATIAYPAAPSAYKDLAIRHWLEACRLAHLADSLDASDNWSARLSPGEQQRLAFVRVLLARPQAVFLDEATSAVDGETEAILYGTLAAELPGLAMVSVAHREQVAQFHDKCWQFLPYDGASVIEQTLIDHSTAGSTASHGRR